MPLFAPNHSPGSAPLTPVLSEAKSGISPRPPRPQLRVCVLGSGSGGNATVLCHDQQAILIDLGFGPRTTTRRLAQAGIGLGQVRAVCLTHLDRDHFRPSAIRLLIEQQVRVYCHHWHLAELQRTPGSDALFDAGLVEPFDADAFEPIAGLTASTVRCQHDRQGTISYRFDSALGSTGHATDLGHVPPRLIEHFANVDLLAIEANYDERMTVNSARPTFVNRRNMSDSGHLSNEQAFEAVQRIARASASPASPRHVVLLHRSSQCNHPTKLRRVFERDPQLASRIILTEQRRRTRWLSIRPQPATRRHQLHWQF